MQYAIYVRNELQFCHFPSFLHAAQFVYRHLRHERVSDVRIVQLEG